MPLLLLALIAVPLVEIAVFIWVGGAIGVGWTLAGILATAIAGTALIRHQGLRVFAEARYLARHHRPPLKPVFDGLCLLVAGALLLTPGFVTDALGFALLIPPLRAVLGGFLWRWLERTGRVTVVTGADTVEGEAVEIPAEPDTAPGSPPVSQSRWGGRRRQP